MRATRRRIIQNFLTEELATPEELTALEAIRPKTRADCVRGIRPCPFVSCRYHLYMEIGSGQRRTILPNFSTSDPTELTQTCALDLAENNGPATLEAIGKSMNMTRERVRQIEKKFLTKLRETSYELYEFLIQEQSNILTRNHDWE